MRAEELTVEVRDRNLNRVGIILTRDLDLTAKVVWSGVGEWTLTLPENHPLVPALKEPGSGLIVTGPVDGGTGVVFSGPRVPAVRVRDQKNPDGTLTFKGVTDEILLDDTLAYPSPGVVDPNAQTVANDVRTGTTESLMRQYVSYNMGPLAPAGRRRGFRSKVVLAGSDLGRGVTTSRSPRFQNLLELLQGLATEGTLGFRLVQVGAQLQFQIVPVRDLRATVRLDLNNGTILSEESQDQGPTLTYAIVAGQGEGIERTMVVRTRSTQTTEESQWGRPIERFYDRRDTDNLLELQAKGDEELSLTGEGVAVKLMPSDDQTMRYLIDWNVGDWVTAVVNGQETWSVATEAVVRATSKFAGVGMSIGDVTSFTPESRAQAQVNKNDSRIGYLERAAAGPIENDRLPGRLQEVGQQVTDWNHAVASGFYWSGSSSANAPTGFATLAFMGEVIQNSGGNLVQILRALNFADDRLKRVWTRVRFSGTWHPWVLDDPTPPSLIAFQAKMSPAAYTHSGASYWNRIPFPVEVLDKGSCYDPVQSRFTAPVAGVYDFDFSVTPSGGSSGPSFAWRKNGGTISVNQADVMGYFTNYATVGGNQIMELAAGDYVEVWVANANNSTVVLQGAYGGFFSGKILR